MVRYRRNRVPHGAYFLTVTLRDRRSDALVRHVDGLRSAWRIARTRVARQVVAALMLPDHLHAVIGPCATAPVITRACGRTSRRDSPATSPPGAFRPGRRFWEHTIRDERDLQAHVDYVHINPLKHGLVGRAADWPYSSFHRYVRRGWLPADWAGVAASGGRFGEPVYSVVSGKYLYLRHPRESGDPAASSARSAKTLDRPALRAVGKCFRFTG